MRNRQNSVTCFLMDRAMFFANMQVPCYVRLKKSGETHRLLGRDRRVVRRLPLPSMTSWGHIFIIWVDILINLCSDIRNYPKYVYLLSSLDNSISEFP